MLAKQLLKDHTTIHVINRAQIIDDALNLAKSGLLDYDTALSVTGYLSKEVEYIPWASALSGNICILSFCFDVLLFRPQVCQQYVEEDSSLWRL